MKRAKRALALLLSLVLMLGLFALAEEPVEVAEVEEIVEEATEESNPEPEPMEGTEEPVIEEPVIEEPEAESIEEPPEEPEQEPVEAMEEDTFELEHFDADEDFVIDENGVLVGYKGSDRDITIPDGVKAIGDRAFYNERGDDYDIRHITSIYIPDGVTSIGEEAFTGCADMKTIRIPDGVTSIGKDAFSVCITLQSIQLPESVTSIGEGAFSLCKALQSFYIPDGVVRIEERTFQQCYGLQKIRIPEGVTSIGARAFLMCQSLQTIDLPEGVTTIGEEAYEGCDSLQIVELPESVTIIGENAFCACDGLQSVYIPNGVTRIEKMTFWTCPALTSVHLPDRLTSIGEDAFYCCSSLQDIDLPDCLTSIGEDAFYCCSSLQDIDFPDSLTSIGAMAFSGCPLQSINIPKGLTELEDHVFSGLKQETITIPSNVKNIGSAFSGCSSLTSVYIQDGVTSIGEYAFSGCDNLKTVTIPGSVKSIGSYAFAQCSALEELVIPEGVTTIGALPFVGFTSSQRVLLPKSLTDIDVCMMSMTSGIVTWCNAMLYVYKNSFAEVFCKDHNVTYKYRTGYESAKITLSFAEKTLTQKETATLKASTEGLKEKYSFESDAPGIAAVSKTTGKITAKKSGFTDITVTGKTSGVEAICRIYVLPAPDMLLLKQTSASCNIGDTAQIEPVISPGKASQDVSWSIPKKQKKYASVDEHGLVTALAEGKVTISVTTTHKNLKGKKLSKKFTLTVVDPKRPTAIHVDPETPQELVMTDGQQVTKQLEYTLEPAETAETEVTWSIPKKAHKSYASVTKEGLLTAKRAGKVQLKVTAKKKNAAGKTLSATVNITITDPTIPTSVTIADAAGAPIAQTIQIKKGEKLALHATCAPETAANAELEWSSSNKKVAKVDKSTGEITAVGKGKAKITAKAKKGGQKASINIQVIK